MSRVALVTTLLVSALSSAAGTIRYDYLGTYDTGNRLINGQWRIGAEVTMTYLNFWGNPAPTTWEANLWINNIHTGSLLVGTGKQTFTTTTWNANVEASAGFDSCYQGKAYAVAGGESLQVGGNHVCTDPRPLPDSPATDDDGRSPLVLSLRGGYPMTSAGDGVRFDIDADGIAEAVAWTQPESEVGFLALDRNGNGRIDSGAELFGDATALPNGPLAINGFEALAALDENGDEILDAGDRSWRDLLLWFDRDHDGASTATELVRISSTGVNAMRTGYQRSGRMDAFGNEFRYQGEFLLAGAWRKCYDVYLVTID